MLCRQTAMQQELEKLRVKLRTADFVRSGSSSGLNELRSASLPHEKSKTCNHLLIARCKGFCSFGSSMGKLAVRETASAKHKPPLQGQLILHDNAI